MLNPIAIKEGRLIHVTNLTEDERGFRCNCVCPECGKPLIAKLGEKKTWHFAHKTEARCDFGLNNSGGESPIHKYAKQIILEEMKVRIDNATLVNFISIEEEHREDDTILDLLGVNNKGEELGIEIFYKHKVDVDKINKLKDRYNNVLEIDIPALIEQDFLNDKKFRRKVINSYPRRLIVNNGYQNNLEYRLTVVNQEEARLKEEERKFFKAIDNKKKFIDGEEFRLNKKITYVSNLKKTISDFEELKELKKEDLEDLESKIEYAKKELEDIERDKQKLQEETMQNLKAKEIELNLREHKIDRIEKENKILKEKIKEVLNHELGLRVKEEKLNSLEEQLNLKKEEQKTYYKYKRQVLEKRAEELDERGRNLVKINKIKWLEELCSKGFISEEQLENIKEKI